MNGLHIDVEGQTSLPCEVYTQTDGQGRGAEVRDDVVGSAKALVVIIAIICIDAEVSRGHIVL